MYTIRGNTPGSFLSARQASVKLSSLLLLCFFILVLHAEPGLAQDRTLQLAKTDQDASRFRVERLTVGNGGELITIWGRVIDESETVSSQTGAPIQSDEIPLISVLRDTFGDAVKENDVLREVWVHTYVRPRLAQRAAALVPFLYKGLRVEPQAPLTTVPQAIINLSDTDQLVWRQLFVSALTNVLVDHPLLRTSVHNYQRNASDYRMSNLMRALTILSLYGSQLQSDSPFSGAELVQMQSQLALTEKTFGGLVDRIHFTSFHVKQTVALHDTRGHNWELLRQQAEASGLYFEPLSLSDKTVTHALLWFPAGPANEDSTAHPFEGRFLNIKNPWRDERLSRWKGYTETKFFNLENQLVLAGDPSRPDTRAVTMIPLALYGLDFKKIPALLIDFRDSANPRRRELSGRLINAITRDVLAISRFGNLYYFLAHATLDFVINRRGIDINQPSRLRSAAELKLLLSFNPSISNGLREQLKNGLERLSVNPLANSDQAEKELAFGQYRALRAYALRPDGLPARLDRERGSEVTKFVHRGLNAKLLRFVNIVTLGHYTHREQMTPELSQRLDTERQLAYHTRFLRQIAKSSPLVEVTWNIELVLPSLRFVAENGSEKDNEAAKAVASIFDRTDDVEAKDLSLLALKRIGNKIAKREMFRIYQDVNVAAKWRTACAEYLRIELPQAFKVAGMPVGSERVDSQQP